MNPSQRRTALIFLAAIAVVAVSVFANGAITVTVAVMFVIGIAIVAFERIRRLAPNRVSKFPAKIVVVCVITALAWFGIQEFIDFQCRRLHLFTQAVTAVQSSPEAAHLLGSPIRVRWPIKAIGILSNDSGETQLTIPVRGTVSPAKLVADGTSVNGSWTMTRLQLVQNGTIVNLQLPAAH